MGMIGFSAASCWKISGVLCQHCAVAPPPPYLTYKAYAGFENATRHSTWKNSVEQGSTNVLSDGHKSYYTKDRGLNILRDVIVLGYVTFYQINKVFHKYIFSLLTKCLRGPCEMALRAGFFPWAAVVCIPLYWKNQLCVLQVYILRCWCGCLS